MCATCLVFTAKRKYIDMIITKQSVNELLCYDQYQHNNIVHNLCYISWRVSTGYYPCVPVHQNHTLLGQLTLKALVVTIDAQWEGMGDVGSARYEPALLPPFPTIGVLSYSN